MQVEDERRHTDQFKEQVCLALLTLLGLQLCLGIHLPRASGFKEVLINHTNHTLELDGTPKNLNSLTGNLD